MPRNIRERTKIQARELGTRVNTSQHSQTNHILKKKKKTSELVWRGGSLEAGAQKGQQGSVDSLGCFYEIDTEAGGLQEALGPVNNNGKQKRDLVPNTENRGDRQAVWLFSDLHMHGLEPTHISSLKHIFPPHKL